MCSIASLRMFIFCQFVSTSSVVHHQATVRQHECIQKPSTSSVYASCQIMNIRYERVLCDWIQRDTFTSSTKGIEGGTRLRSWLRHCATSRKATGLIPDGVIGIFYWQNPCCRTMTLGLSRPPTEISTRNISWRQRRPVRRADNLTTFMWRLSWNLGASISWYPQGLSRPVMGLLYLYLLPRGSFI
jgi:hypothetical protein